MRRLTVWVVLAMMISLPVAAQFPGLGLPGVPLPGLGGMPVVDIYAIVQLVKQLAEQVALHEISTQQLAQLLLTYQRITQQYNQTVFNATTLPNLVNFRSSWSLWYLVSALNTYGYNLGWTSMANGQYGPGYYSSVLPLPALGSMATLSPATVQQVQYQYSQAQLADSVAETTLNVTGGIRATAAGTEAALNHLRDATLDPAASEVQVLQKISAGAYIGARTQNDTNKLLAASAETAAFQAKLKRDEIQAAAVDYQETLLRAPEVRASMANASQEIHGFRFSSIP
jgi:hypothetical protein